MQSTDRNGQITLNDAARRLNLNVKAVSQLVEDGELTVVRTGKFGAQYLEGSAVRAFKADLDTVGLFAGDSEFAKEIAQLRAGVKGRATILA